VVAGLLNVGAEEACVDFVITELNDVPVLPVVVGGLGDLIVAFSSGFLNVPGAVVVVVFGVAAVVVTGVFVNDVVALLFAPNVRLDVTVGLAEVVVLVVLGLLNEGEEDVVVAAGFFSSAL
jgi:hypothetical protein